MLFMSIIIHGQNILRGVLEEKATRVAEVVISSVKPETLLAGQGARRRRGGTDAADRLVRDHGLSHQFPHARSS